tara:strand:+ start:42 stop:359 length:318 start_codon:yes stop_codon:yes gene_type:complete
MKLLEYKKSNYFVDGKKVRPILVGGPVDFSYEFRDDEDPDELLEEALEKITSVAMNKLALEKVPDAYLYKGIAVRQPEMSVADGKVPARNMRHGSLFYFRTEIVK